MKCRICRTRPREFFIRSYKLPLCRRCFLQRFEKRVQAAVEKYRMFAGDDRVVVGISGGKDSMALWKVLADLGYAIKAVHIHLGLGSYSHTCEDLISGYAAQKGYPLDIVRVETIFGAGMQEIARKVNRASCQACGTIKRYLLNQAARDAHCVVTGHHLDDGAALLLGNLLNWQEESLSRQYPVLQGDRSLAKKVKPFVLTLEEEIRYYSELCEIPSVEEKCPLQSGATSSTYHQAMELIERKMPGTKIRFYKDFLRKNPFEGKSDRDRLRPCETCGYLTVKAQCNFCEWKQRVRSDAQG
ncbi:MAG: tRNA(Ile)-lysidine synthetase [Candidatus Omnitrophica bacterium]|nr:tRNA(Ile)-lysidine synthetase [Candidatus Omnitrophota bacterium]